MVVLYIIVGILGGLVGGMGLGGGTLFVPLAVYLLGFEQRTAGFLNLAAFVPMSIIALSLHVKNGYVDFKKALPLIVGGAAAAVFGSLLAKDVSPDGLTKYFGIFLAFLGVWGFFQKN